MESLEWCWRERVDVRTMDQATFARFDGFPGQMAAALGCGGPRLQLSLSCASGAAALALAADLIRGGRAERVLAIGYDLITEFCWCGLTNLHTITTDCMRPFDLNRSGTVFSEGAAAMLLERNGVRSAPARGLLAGVATNNNAFHMTAPARDADGSRRVMAAALDDAGLEPEAVDHVCAHATSTKANDVTEAAALGNLFGERLAGLTVAAHKSQLGHLMGAAGLAEAVITLEVIRGGVVPPTVNHVTPDPECPVDCVRGSARRRVVRCAITNSAGIGGNNSSVVLEAAP
jgi:3-oxoacyl-(acyl-carrier-protein) synthase